MLAKKALTRNIHEHQIKQVIETLFDRLEAELEGGRPREQAIGRQHWTTSIVDGIEDFGCCHDA